MTNNDNIKMNDAIWGLERFFRDCNPHKITWGIIFRTEFDLDGVRRLHNIIDRLERNASLAQAFLDHHSPSDLERRMVSIFAESTEGYISESRAHLDYIQQCLDEERSIEERIEVYELAAMYIPPLRQGDQDELPF